MTKTRFAPSPTGYMHIGSLRTALYAYLFSKSTGGEFVLRIEDTDQNRFIKGAVEKIIKTMDDFNLEYNEGPILSNNIIKEKGDFGPYIQSKRTKIYQEHAAKLISNSHAYHCFCTEERLKEMREKQEKTKKAPKYDKTCCNLSKETIENNLKEGVPFVIRLKVRPAEIIEFKDEIRGKVQVNSSDIDDQVLIKSDGHPTYHLANVVDDHLMEITHVIRAEEWLPSTPKHVLLYRAFGWKPPIFAHLPLVLNPDKSKLSKRQGSVAVEDFLKEGYLKEALINFIAFLGWNPKNEQEIFGLKELEKQFSLNSINKSGAVFNIKKLNWINKQHLKKLSDNNYFKACAKYLNDYKEQDQEILRKAVLLEKERIEKLSEIGASINFVFKIPKYESELLIWKKLTIDEVKSNLLKIKTVIEEIDEKYFNKTSLEQKIIAYIKENNFGVGDMLWPLRVSLSGKKNSPGPFEIMEVLGKEEVLKRIGIALSK